VDKANQAKHHTEIAIVIEEAANKPKSVGSQSHFMNFQERQPVTGKYCHIYMAWLFYA
jgi:hypothetical protein